MELADVSDSKSTQLFVVELFEFLPQTSKNYVIPTFQHSCISHLVEKVMCIYRKIRDFFYQI